MSQPTRVLLIEDDEDDYVLIQELLSNSTQSDYELEWVQTYAGGLDAIAARNHDICILDYRLGAHDGLELLREATKDGFHIPAIILTGQDDHDPPGCSHGCALRCPAHTTQDRRQEYAGI